MASPRSSMDMLSFLFLLFQRLGARLIERLQFSGLECVRCNDHLLAGSAKLLQVPVCNVAELHIDDARIGPFAAWPVANAADNGFHLVCTDICRQYLIVEALGCSYCLRQDLANRVVERRQVKAQRVDIGLTCLCLIARQKLS